ncbi:MAG: hypothetical protein DRH34_13130 [Deltaproteobacteria bacterium]|nr:MAG: hypothetical protein DRH34_13130 [Deltaproteobacteria bacterium]
MCCSSCLIVKLSKRLYNTCPPLLSPPKGGRRIKGMKRFLLSQANKPGFSKFMVPCFFRLGKKKWDFGRDLR